jgi:hypothetical protein
LQTAKDFAVNFMRESSQWSADISKPIFLEEFGMARNNWENKDKEYPYLSSASTTNKDEYFKVCSIVTFSHFNSLTLYRPSSAPSWTNSRMEERT